MKAKMYKSDCVNMSVCVAVIKFRVIANESHCTTRCFACYARIMLFVVVVFIPLRMISLLVFIAGVLRGAA